MVKLVMIVLFFVTIMTDVITDLVCYTHFHWFVDHANSIYSENREVYITVSEKQKQHDRQH